MRDLGNRFADRSSLPVAALRRRGLAAALVMAGLLPALPAAAQQYITADRNVIIDYGALETLGPSPDGPVVIGGPATYGNPYPAGSGAPLPAPATAPSSTAFVPKPFVPGPIAPIKRTQSTTTAASPPAPAPASTTAAAVTPPPPPSPAPAPVPPLVPSTAATAPNDAPASTTASEMPAPPVVPAPPAAPEPEPETVATPAPEAETVADAVPEPPDMPAPPDIPAPEDSTVTDSVTTPDGDVAVTNNLGATTPPPPEAPPVEGWPTDAETPPPPTAPESPVAAEVTDETVESADEAVTVDEEAGEAVADVEEGAAQVEAEAAEAVEDQAAEDENAEDGQSAALPPELPAGESLRITFASESAELPPDMLPQLDQIADKMLGDEALRLQLMAYAAGTEDTASKARRISLSRALAVRAYLISKGIRSSRMDVRALGNNVEGEPADRVDLVAQTP